MHCMVFCAALQLANLATSVAHQLFLFDTAQVTYGRPSLQMYSTYTVFVWRYCTFVLPVGYTKFLTGRGVKCTVRILCLYGDTVHL